MPATRRRDPAEMPRSCASWPVQRQLRSRQMSSTAENVPGGETDAVSSGLAMKGTAFRDWEGARGSPEGHRYPDPDIGIRQLIRTAVEKAHGRAGVVGRPDARPPA